VTLGAVPSAVTVKEVALEPRPALFVAVTLLGSLGSTALVPKLKLRLGSEPEALQPEPRAGKL